MTFLWSDALWLLLALPALVGAYVVLLLRHKKGALRYSSAARVREAIGPAQRIGLHVPALIFLLALVLNVMAIARPAIEILQPVEQRILILAIDVSYSMAATDVAPTRLEAVQRAAKNLIRAQPRGMRIGIVAFGTYADLVQAPTSSRMDAAAAVDRLQYQYGSGIGTAILAALLTISPDVDIGYSYEIFGMGRSPLPDNGFPHARRPEAAPPGSAPSAAIVLLTDGQSTVGISPLSAANLSARRGVPVFAVGVGRAGGVTIDVEGWSVIAGFEPETLKKVAEVTRGEYFHATDAEELKDIHRKLSGRVALERKESEVTAVFAALAAILALASGFLSLLWSNRFA